MDIETLQYFVKIADTLNFRRAAEELFVSQSTLSRRISLLEKELGVSLFDRTTRTVTVSEAGRELISNARTIVNNFEQMRLKAGRLSGNIGGHLGIGFYGWDTMHYMSVIYNEVKERYPSVNIEMISEDVESLRSRLEDGTCDAALLLKPCIDDQPDIERWTVARELPSIVVSENHPLAAREIVGVEELIREHILIVTEEPKGRVFIMLNELIGNCGIEAETVYGRLTEKVVMRLVTGECIMLDPHYYGDNNVAPGLKRVPVRCDDRFDRQIFWRRDNDNPVLEIFLTTMRKMFERG